jgi:hypothetical protein
MFHIWYNDNFLNNHNRYAFHRFTCWLIVDELDNRCLSVVDERFMRWTDFMTYWFFVFNDWSIVVEDFSFFEIFDFLNLLKTALILNFFFKSRQFVAMCSMSLHLWQMKCEWFERFRFFSSMFFDDFSSLFCRWTNFYFLASRLCFAFYWTTFWSLTNDCRTSFERRLFSSCCSSDDLLKSIIFSWWWVNSDNLSTQRAASIWAWWINELYAAFQCTNIDISGNGYKKLFWRARYMIVL